MEVYAHSESVLKREQRNQQSDASIYAVFLFSSMKNKMKNIVIE